MKEAKKVKSILYMPDGNRRFARKNKIPLDEAYAEGVKTLILGSEFFLTNGISDTFIYHAMSDYTHQRTDLSLEPIHDVFRKTFSDLEKEDYFENNDISFKAIDHSGRVPQDIMDIARKMEDSTKNLDKNLFVLLGYSLEQDYNSSLANHPQNYKELRNGLIFSDINLVIRPKEMRASRGPIYAMAQSQMITLDRLNPEVRAKDFERVLNEYFKWENYKTQHSANPIHQEK